MQAAFDVQTWPLDFEQLPFANGQDPAKGRHKVVVIDNLILAHRAPVKLHSEASCALVNPWAHRFVLATTSAGSFG